MDISEKVLIRLYHLEDMSQEAIGKLYGITRQAVSLQMAKKNIPTKKRKQNQYTVLPRIIDDGTVGEE